MTNEEKELYEMYSDESVVLNKFKNLFTVRDYICVVVLITLRLLIILLYSFLHSVPIGLIMIFLMPLELLMAIFTGASYSKYHSKSVSYRRISEAVPFYLGSLEDASSVPKYRYYTNIFLALLLSIILDLIFVGIHGI